MENQSLTITKSGQSVPGSLASGTQTLDYFWLNPSEFAQVLRTNDGNCSRRARATPKATHTTTLPEIHPDPLQFAITQLGFQPDAPQTAMLVNPYPYLIVNCSRQWGKSTVTAIRALHLALTVPESLIIVAGPTSRQSGEFVMKVEAMLRRLGIRTHGDGNNEESIQFPNGSRLVGIPGTLDGNVRGFSGANFLIIDEASRVSESLYAALRPFLATTNGNLWLLSTPFGKSGFFYHEWTHSPYFEHLEVPATECDRISPAFLERERASLGDDYVRQEFLCQFIDINGSLFIRDVIDRSLNPEIAPLFAGSTSVSPHIFHIGLDLGQRQDFCALAIVECIPAQPAHWLHPRSAQPAQFHLRYLERFPLRTPYLAVIKRLRELTNHPEIAHRCRLSVDASGLGEPVFAQFRSAELPCPLNAVSITGGEQVHPRDFGDNVPKRDLMAAIHVVLEEEQLQIAASLPETRRLVEEMMNLHPGRNSRHHDDLVIALGLALWQARRPEIGPQQKRLL